MSRVVLVTGGARSGKSRYALDCARRYENRVFIATSVPMDREMEHRIREHQEARGASFRTVEEPLDIAGAIKSLPRDTDVGVIDCITVWLGNLLHRHGGDCETLPEIKEFLGALRAAPCDLIVVTNEVGMGIVPANELARRFRDLAGRLNQDVAGIAEEVVLLVCGIPVPIKERRTR